ncbi:RNA polymerase sigma factor SigJ [Nonomuraea sp. NBC_01738]|uniref:RNA polymerase sigma factor SigJ n=1 Tax=Nonomuraea sp. NBC_01738 TaxID=2976003 RepID=UPI002E0E9C66|nr:RNA polymerase sigma factor SigJ [Nonomuraea sp. NBC_01738]
MTDEVFFDHRELLFSIVYGMLGSVADTEDVLQETWMAWSGRRSAELPEHPRAYLVRVAVNQALARRKTLSTRRETYYGPWLPEPLVAGADEPVERAESLSMALLVVLETLTPLERAVFVLHEAFGYQLTEIAAILGRSAASVRQLAHRAREHVRARRPRQSPDPALKRELTERFTRAAFGGDMAALLEILAPEVTLWSDGGGKATAAGPRPIHGRDNVARLLMNRTAKPFAGLDIRYRRVNGEPSAVIFVGEEPFAVMVLDLEDDQVKGIYVVTNPDKLTTIAK